MVKTGLGIFITITSILALVSLGDLRQIQLVRNEIKGTDQIQVLISDSTKNQQTNYDLILEQSHNIGDTSGLILDPDLDTYYLMILVTDQFPRLISDIKAQREADIPEHFLLVKDSLKRIKKYDADFYGSQDFLMEELGIYENSLDEVLSGFNQTEKALSVTLEAWNGVNQILKQMLQVRQSYLFWRLTLILILGLGAMSFGGYLIFHARQIAATLKARNSQLEKADKLATMGEMASGIAHEINNLLTVAISQSNRLLKKIDEGSVSQDEVRQRLEKQLHNLKLISGVVKGIKTLSRNSESDEFQDVSIQSILEDVKSLCQERIKSEGVELKLELNGDYTVKGLPAQIFQVILNFINNAIDAISAQEEKWILVRVMESDGRVLIQVFDSGPRIPDEVASKLSEAFFTTKKNGKGTGLGLSISKKIAQNHGGELYLDRSKDKTCFVFNLPRSESQNLASKAVRSEL
jgi:signal transduction histidine kinase